MKKRDVAGLLLYVVMFLGGIALLVTDEDIVVGLILMLAGGSFTLFAALPLFRSRAAPVRIATLDGEPSFVLDVARGKEIAILVALFGILAASVVMVMTGSPRAWVTIVVLIPVSLWWSWRVVRGGRAITLTPTRVVLTVDDREELRWAEFEAALAKEDLDLHEFVASPEQIGRIASLYCEDAERRAAIGTEAELARVI